MSRLPETRLRGPVTLWSHPAGSSGVRERSRPGLHAERFNT